ncbi:phosphatidate cytidylyltransferase [Neisseria dentiae]|uniref:Phosphatidate cytidylyltransferase n=1 Tax=Neisseria dentiae TaxID=194197 RepID=A0A1X3DGL2_9NEIS|nr:MULTISPECIES: phosphatidate cytidylyltransferase [Neisseria]MDO4227187.1 phosphatidate cytidylyltransferase [Neisseria sp.]OSI18831.1 phosphatidate cytidylyltransferase [Neisseria dentiae]QMT46174.1 phosphatidate cytidylyltransferase [Neisseria dentiae]STZ52279.1 phosphatidate cytidylyltransferase [Neisseria dentiae]
MNPFVSTVSPHIPPQAGWIFTGIFAVLVLASVIGQWLKRKKGTGNATIANLNARVYAWWVMTLVLLLAFWFGKTGTVILFFLISFAALREFLTLVYKRRSDYNVMLVCFYVLLPVQYYFVYTEWYGMFSIFIPVYGFLLLPIIASLSGKTEDFLQRTAKTQWAAMIAVFCLSHVPALMNLRLEGFAPGQNVLLLIFMIGVVQSSDVLQYIWGKTIGRRKIMPALSPSKTVAGTVGGIASATLLAVLMAPITPFTAWQAGLIGLIICLMGFFGGLVMSAIKRDHGVKDWGNMIQGHGGMLDRVDSICFAAPVFFHIVRYFWNG